MCKNPASMAIMSTRSLSIEQTTNSNSIYLKRGNIMIACFDWISADIFNRFLNQQSRTPLQILHFLILNNFEFIVYLLGYHRNFQLYCKKVIKKCQNVYTQELFDCLETLRVCT